MDPYQSPKKAKIKKMDLIGKLITVHGTIRENRKIEPMIQRTRVVNKGEAHELLIGKNYKKGEMIEDTAYIGFVEFLETGLLKQGDKLYIRWQEVGRIIGFDDTHMPNHLNIIIGSPEFKPGIEWGFSPGFTAFFIENN